jgi:competence ComEA-like helix-hairpin-helix protein
MSLIKINSASLQELTQLSNIGPARAQQILSYRETTGPIDSVSKLVDITGISEEQGNILSDQIDWNIYSESSTVGNITFETIRLLQYKIDLSSTGINSYEGFKLQIFYSLDIGGEFSFFSPVSPLTPISPYLSFPYQNTAFQQSITVTEIPASGIVEGLRSLLQPIANLFTIILYAPNNTKVLSNTTNDISDYKVQGYIPPVKAKTNFIITIDGYDKLIHQHFKLVIIRKVSVQSDETIQRTSIVDIAADGTHKLIPPANEEIQQLRFQLVAPNGATIGDSGFLDWDAEENKVDSKIGYNLKISKPEKINSVIIIEEKPIDELPWANHRFVISYELFDFATNKLIGIVEKELSISVDGKVIIDFDYYGEINEFNLQLIAPSGEKLHTEIVRREELGAEYAIPVSERKIVDITQYEILPERPAKTVGRVIDSSGKSTLSGIQVIIYATQDELLDDEDEKQAKYDPILVALTETDGYFVLDTPQSHYTAAYALIGQISEKKIPVRLEEDTLIIRERVMNDGGEEIFQESTVEKQFLPDKLILVVDSDYERSSEECDCNECKTLDFHKPYRVLEEFSYYSVVRTSEPQIQGYTLEEDGTMALSELKDIVPDLNTFDIKLDQTIRKSILQKYINSKQGLTSENFRKAIRENRAQNLRENITPPSNQARALGRYTLDTEHVIDWDDTPTIYQATTLAFGHLLQYKQEWLNDGYSLGEPLYSLPLAPGQKKQIVVFDWERRESAERAEDLDYTESLYNSLGRNRDVHEIVGGVLTENSRAGSRARTSSASAGFGLGFLGGGFGALLGASGGKSSSSSSAWQHSARRSSMNDLQTLRDKTVQSANATRSQRATVVQSASQGERFSAETETIANYNHCHAITIVYFEILRHFKIEHRAFFCSRMPLCSFDHVNF